MKVEKGYTLSQFIDFVKNKQHDESVISFEKAQAIKLKWVYQYDDILKKHIEIEMFEGLKKIFDYEWSKIDNSTLGFDTILFSNGNVCFEFYEDGDVMFMNEENYEYNVETLDDLFRVCKSNLKLINVNVF